MQTLFAILVFLSLLGIVLGLIKPAWVFPLSTNPTRLRTAGWYLLAMAIFTTILVLITNRLKEQSVTAKPEISQTVPAAKDAAPEKGQ